MLQQIRQRARVEVEEVLQRLSPEVRSFLFRTCFLGRLNGSLCDAVIGKSTCAILD